MPETIARYEGAWARQAKDWYGDEDRFTVSGPTDPEHGNKEDAPAPLMMDAPVLPSGGEIITDSIFENVERLPEGMRIDETPVEGQGTPEESGHGYGGLFRIGATEGDLGASRGRPTGAAKRATSSSPVYQFFNEQFFGFFTRGFEPPPITKNPGNPVFIRGVNSHMVNNGGQSRPTAWRVEGDGWKRGFYESSNVNRDFTPPNRTHGQVKMVEPDIVTIIGDVPPPDKSDTYASPFSSLQKFLPKRRKVRGMRREPGAFDEDLQAMTPVGDILTSSADGMVVN